MASADSADSGAPAAGGRPWWRLAVCLLSLALFGWLAVRYAGRELQQVGDRLREMHPAWLPAIAGLYLVTRLQNSEIMRLLLRRLGHALACREVFSVLILQTYTNLFVSKAGAGTAAAYLKLRHGVPVADFGSVMAISSVLQFVCLGVGGLAAQAVLRLHSGVPVSMPLAVAFAGISTAALAFLLVRVPVPARLPARARAFVERLNLSLAQLSRLRGPGTGVATLVAQQVVILILRTARLQMVFLALGYSVDPVATFIASACGDVGLLVAITPMGLGFREAAIGYSAHVTGISAQAAVVVAVVDRIVWSTAVALVAQVVIWTVTRRPPAPAAPR